MNIAARPAIAALSRWLPAVAATLMLAACASTPPPRTIDPNTPASLSVDQTTANPVAISDPLEPLNRRIYRFNALIDSYLLLPMVRGYEAVTPKPVRTGVANFFSNLGDINTLVNSALQLKPQATAVTLTRLVFNTTLGIGGIFDPATDFGLRQRHEDFGLTLGHYGVGAGPYLVLPLFGPSDLRDSVGLVADQALFYQLDPLQLGSSLPKRVVYNSAYLVNKRYTTKFRYYQTGSPFEYTLVRLVYLNYRALEVAR